MSLYTECDPLDRARTSRALSLTGATRRRKQDPMTDIGTNIGTYGELAAEPRVDVLAIAEIVQDLLAGGLSRLQDGSWLRERSEVASLGRHEYAALQAFGARLSESGATAFDGIKTGKLWL